MLKSQEDNQKEKKEKKRNKKALIYANFQGIKKGEKKNLPKRTSNLSKDRLQFRRIDPI